METQKVETTPGWEEGCGTSGLEANPGHPGPGKPVKAAPKKIKAKVLRKPKAARKAKAATTRKALDPRPDPPITKTRAG